jgi:hypothetical protein
MRKKRDGYFWLNVRVSLIFTSPFFLYQLLVNRSITEGNAGKIGVVVFLLVLAGTSD